MRARSIVLWALSAVPIIATAQDADRATIAPGFYSLAELARQLSTAEHPVRIAPNVAHRAAFASFHDRTKSEALALVCIALGLQVQAESSGRTITLADSSKLATLHRAWQSETMAVLRQEVVSLANAANSLSALSEDRLKKRLEELASQAGDSPGKTKPAPLAAKVAMLAIEFPLLRTTRPALLAALRNTDSSTVMRGAQLDLCPIDRLGPDFLQILDEDYAGGLAWSHKPIDACLIGWRTSMVDGYLLLEPVLTLMGNRFVHLTNQSEIGQNLPTQAAVERGLGLGDQLFVGGNGLKPILDKNAQAWYVPMSEASSAFLAGVGKDLQKPAESTLSAALLEWSRNNGKDVVMELSPATDVASHGASFQEKFPNWRLRVVNDTLVALDTLAFWHRNRPLPVANLIDAFGLAPKTSDPIIPTEGQLKSYYRSSPILPIDWYETSAPPADYYGIDLRRLDGGRALMAIWDELQGGLREPIRSTNEGKVEVPISTLSPETFARVVELFRAEHPDEPDFLQDDFANQLRQMHVSISWDLSSAAKKKVTLWWTSPEGGIGDTLLETYLRAVAEFYPGRQFEYVAPPDRPNPNDPPDRGQ